MFRLTLSELTHILHCDLLPVFRPVNPLSQVADAAVFHPDKRMGNDLQFGDFGQVHCKIFILGQHCETICLGFEDIAAPEPHDCKLLGILMLVEIQRQFRLDAGQSGLRLDNLDCQVVHLFAGVIQNGC